MPANRVRLIGDGRSEERLASVQIPVASLVMNDGAGGFAPHNIRGGVCERVFALERGWEGIAGSVSPKAAWDPYLVGELVFATFGQQGDVLSCLIKAGENVAVDSLLMSAGDGTLVNCPAGSGSNVSKVYSNAADSTTITNVTAETPFSLSYTIPANSLAAGDVIRIRGAVTIPSTNSTDTLTLKLKIGSTVLVTTVAVDVANNDVGYFDALITIRTIGASGTLVAVGQSTLGVPGTAVPRSFVLGSTAVDTTAAQALTMTATWSVANTSNQCALSSLVVEMERGSPYYPVGVALDAVNNSAGVTPAQGRIRVL